MTNISAMARARSMIDMIPSSLAVGLAERNKAMTEGYIAALFEAGLIDRDEFEDLETEAELAFTVYLKSAPKQHL